MTIGPHGKGAPQASAFQCVGCGEYVEHRHGTAVVGPFGTFPSCHRCRAKAQASPRFRREFQTTAQTARHVPGVTLPRVQALFAGLGVFELPQTGEDFDRAVGLPIGSTEAALGGWAPR